MDITAIENDKLDDLIDKLHDLKYSLKNNYESFNSQEKTDTVSRLVVINDKIEELSIELEQLQHELDTKDPSPSPEIEKRIFEYNKEQEIMKPFIPALFLYSCYINNFYQ
jgi:hypothetical protein